jgi:hypothetical protein
VVDAAAAVVDVAEVAVADVGVNKSRKPNENKI